MDPISAIGIAASVIQFVTFGLELAKRLDEFERLRPGEIPKSLQAIRIQIPLLLNALDKIKSDSEISKLDLDTKCILRGVIAGCHAQIVEVEVVMNQISRSAGEAFKTQFKKVFRSLKYDEKIWAVERNLNTYISVLILHHVIDSSTAPAAPAEDTFFDVREQQVDPFSERPRLMKELEGLLYDASRSQVKNPTIVTLAGPKGVGKTQLALSYCHSANLQKQFRTVFWLDASSIEKLSLGFESVFSTIRRSTNASREDKISFVRGFLDDLWHPWLLVLDNYEPAVLYNNIMEMLPTRGYGGIILITRAEEDSQLGSTIRVPKFLTPEDQRHLNSLLTQAVQNEKVDQIEKLVDQGADVNTLIWNEWPCLFRCALFGLHDSVDFLLQRGADLDPPVNIQKALYWAASGGYEKICELLLDHEDHTSQAFKPADIQSAFTAAADKGNVGILLLLLNRRSKYVDYENWGREPLQKAASKGYVDVINFLFDERFLKPGHMQQEQEEAFLSAAREGHIEIVKILCKKGMVGTNCRNKQGTALYQIVDLYQAMGRGKIEHDGTEIAEFLLENGADPNLLGNGSTGEADSPLRWAAAVEHLKLMHMLLQHGADPIKEATGWSPLETAIKYNSPKAATVLLEAKITDPEARSAWINAALLYACRKGEREYIFQLLTAGADVNTTQVSGPSKGATPLLLAILDGHVKAAQLLIRRGAKQELGDDNGRFPLPTAAKLGYDSVVRDLIRAGGDPNMKSGVNEDTLLIIAAENNQSKVVNVLLQNKADSLLMNKFGDTPLDMAEEKGYKEIIELLE